MGILWLKDSHVRLVRCEVVGVGTGNIFRKVSYTQMGKMSCVDVAEGPVFSLIQS